MLLLNLVFILLWKASVSQISMTGNASVNHGSDAVYTCTLDNPKGVRQVTWHRLYQDQSIQKLASYSDRFGQQVEASCVGKVLLTAVPLGSTSITLRNITWQDESCYVCSFNIFPEGSKESHTCLTVQGISQVKISPRIISAAHTDEREAELSCSATGKPAPTIEWDFSAGALLLDKPTVTTVTNDDLTFTSSSNITLRLRPQWEGHVDCLINRGMESQRTERTSFSSRQERKRKGNAIYYYGLFIIPFFPIIIIFCIIFFLKQKRLKREAARAECYLD